MKKQPPIAHVSREIADAFGMEGLPNTIVEDNIEKHTPTPWIVSPNSSASICTDLETRKTITRCIEPKDAAYIVRAVNAHEGLLAFVARIALMSTLGDLRTEARVLIAKAEGK